MPYSSLFLHKMLTIPSIATLLLLTLLQHASHTTFTLAQTSDDWVNPIRKPIIPGKKVFLTTPFGRIPNFAGRPAKIVSMIPFRSSFFVCTSVSGGHIYRVFPKGSPAKLWFDVNEEVSRLPGRSVDFTDTAHGGVRSVAFHPKFSSNGRFYVSYMERRNFTANRLQYFSRFKYVIPADSVVVEFQADPTTMKVIPNTYRQVIRIGMRVYDHPIKQLLFHDDLLYIAHGDGSVQSGITGGGQGNDGLGKILRIDPLQYGAHPYRIPPTNPFYGNNTPVAWPTTKLEENQTYRPEIYALGYRNPHNLCFSRQNELFVADAGRDNVEEVNLVQPGDNCGWPKREGPFVQLLRGGVGSGVKPLPFSDAKNNFRYPVAVFGHEGYYGSRFIGQAIAMSCPIDNNSTLKGLILFANFPTDGRLYYSYLSQMRRAVTKGHPKELSRALVFEPKMFYDPDGAGPIKPFPVSNLLDIIRYDRNSTSPIRVDMRFGVGPDGTIYWTSKTTGRMYVVTTTIPPS